MVESNSWHLEVPNDAAFQEQRLRDVLALSKKNDIRQAGLEILKYASSFGFGHKNSWMGVPIIRLPEDIMVQQQIIWSEKPDVVVEVGVARGGGLLLNASLQSMCGLLPKVIGIDNKIFEHTKQAISSSVYSDSIKLIEGDSVSDQVLEQVAKITTNVNKALLVLDSDHSSDHVLEELRKYTPILPEGSIVIVCDTLIDEYPPNTYPDRSWANGKGPLDAVRRFFDENNSLIPFMSQDSRALILSEIRDGILIKKSS
jgi:cephalosporin hydroxylase